MNAFHQRYDVLVTPMLPLVAFEAGHNVPPGSGMAQWMEWTPFSYPFNLTQQPAASVPCGFTRKGLPVGLQVVAGRFADEQVLRVCKVYEQHYPSRTCKHRLLAEICMGLCGPFAGEPAPTRTDYWLKSVWASAALSRVNPLLHAPITG